MSRSLSRDSVVYLPVLCNCIARHCWYVVVFLVLALASACVTGPRITSDTLNKAKTLAGSRGALLKGKRLYLAEVGKPMVWSSIGGRQWGAVSIGPILTIKDGAKAYLVVKEQLYTYSAQEQNIEYIADLSRQISSPTSFGVVKDNGVAQLLDAHRHEIGFLYFTPEGTQLVHWNHQLDSLESYPVVYPLGVDIDLLQDIYVELAPVEEELRVWDMVAKTSRFIPLEEPFERIKLAPSAKRALVFYSPLREQGTICLVDLTTGEKVPLTHGARATWLDDERLLFTRNENELWVHDTTTNEEMRLIRVGDAPVRKNTSRAETPAVSWDGRNVIWQWHARIDAENTSGLVLIDLVAREFATAPLPSSIEGYGWIKLPSADK